MRIKKIDIHGFGKLNNLSLEFDDKINVVFGNNEAGKSTLQTFIKAMFFSIKSKERNTKNNLSNMEKYKPIDNSPYEGTLTYSLDNLNEYIIERNFDNNTAKLYDSNLTDVSSQFDKDKITGLQFAKEHLGLGLSSFEETCFIGQSKVFIPGANGKRIIDDLSDHSSDSLDVMSYESAREALMNTLKTSVGTDRTKKSPINIVENKLSELYDEKRSLEAKRDYFLKFSNILQNPNFQKNDLSILIDSCEDNEDLKNELHEYMTSMEEYDNKLNELKNVADGLEKQLATYKQMLIDYQDTLNLHKIFRRFSQGTVDDLLSSKKRILDLRNKSEEFSLELAKLTKPSSVSRFLFLILFIFFVTTTITFKKYWLIGPAVASFSLFSFSNKKYSAEKFKFTANKEYLESRKSGCEREIIDLNEVITSTISRANTSSIEEFVALKSKYDSTHTLYTSSKQSIINCEERIKSVNESINDYRKLTADIINNLKTKFNISTFNKDLSELGQKITSCEEEKSSLEGKKLAIKIALDTLEEANNELSNSFIPTLNRKLSDILGKITNQKYTKLSCNNSFDINAKHVDSMYIVSPQYLSGGTVDQIYLALRIGLCDVISESTSESLPLIFDEIFAWYDDTRTKLTIDYLKELSLKHQIILFTCKHRELEMLQDTFGNSLNIIKLD
ncbi:MAG: AAA family ATPase [Clostridiales bacterium]|nr:AAA family ATPase [Clostridiales bacterium]